MRGFLIGFGLVGLVAVGFGQEHAFSGAYAFDLARKGAPVPVVSYAVRSFTDVFGRKGFNLDLVGVSTLSDNTRLGFGLVYRTRRTIPFSKEFRPKVEFTFGPWANYGTGSRRLGGGLFFGFGGSF